MKSQYDQHRKEALTYKKGDMVWLDAKNLKLPKGLTKKLGKRVGPFPIETKVGEGAYRLMLPPQWEIHNVFGEDLLKPYTLPSFPSQEREPPPPPEIIGDIPEYEVDKVIDSIFEGCGRKLKYLVLWKGYPKEEATWEPWENLKKAQEAITDFHTAHPEAPKRLRHVDHAKLFFCPYENLTNWEGEVHDWTQGHVHEDTNLGGG